MKRQLDRLKGKRLVTGDPNLMTKDEICINATPNGVEVKEIGIDGSIKDIASGGGGGNNNTSNDIKYYHLKVQYPDDVMMPYGLFASIFKLVPTDEAKEQDIIDTIIGNAILVETALKGIYSTDYHYFGTVPFIKIGEVIYNSIEEYCVSTGVDFNSYFERITEEEFLNS